MEPSVKKYIFDFDSTITSVEALDVLVPIVSKRRMDVSEKILLAEIEKITCEAMEGRIGFDEALTRRLALLQIQLQDIVELISVLKTKISNSFMAYRSFFEENKEHIYVVSGGFVEYIVPVVSQLHIDASHVFANQFVNTEQHQFLTHDAANYLAQPLGKVKTLEKLNLCGEVIAIGDGYTDYELKLYGQAQKFYVYAEHANRASIFPKADGIAFSFDDLKILLNG